MPRTAGLAPTHRLAPVQAKARRRIRRARVAAVAVALAVAWAAPVHRASAQGNVPPSAQANANRTAPTIAALERDREAQPLGAPLPHAPAEGTSALFEVARMVGALAVVVALLLAARWWMRRTGMVPAAGAGAFEVVARHTVGRGQQVLVVRFGPRLLCVQQTREGLRTLSELADSVEVEQALTAVRTRGSGTPESGARASAERVVDLRRTKERAP